jgi:hypothetical protein
MTVLGKNNHRLPSIGVITHTISQFTSSCIEKNMITHSTTSSGTISWILRTCIDSEKSLGCNDDSPWNYQSSIAIDWGDGTYNFTIPSSCMEKNMITQSTTSSGTLSWI